jgi:hypothetical protein
LVSISSFVDERERHTHLKSLSRKIEMHYCQRVVLRRALLLLLLLLEAKSSEQTHTNT